MTQEQPVDVRNVIANAIADAYANAPVTGREAPTFGAMADEVIKAFNTAGIEVMTPQDLAWGECDGFADEGQHRISLSLCAGCLEYDPE